MRILMRKDEFNETLQPILESVARTRQAVLYDVAGSSKEGAGPVGARGSWLRPSRLSPRCRSRLELSEAHAVVPSSWLARCRAHQAGRVRPAQALWHFWRVAELCRDCCAYGPVVVGHGAPVEGA